MRRPFLGIGISSVIGIIISYYFKVDMFFSFALLLIGFLIYGILVYRDINNSYFILILSLVIGLTLGSYRLNSSVLIKNIEKSLNISGIVDQVSSQDEDQSRYILKVSSISENDGQKTTNEKTMLKIIGESKLELGDRIEFRGNFKIPMENTNPKLYNYRENLISKDIYTTITIKSGDIFNIDTNNREFKYRIRDSFKDRVESSFDKYLNDENSDLIKGIVLGDYNYLDEDYLKAYREIGLAHILAVSGLHIGIIAGALVFFLSRIGLSRKWNISITIAIIWIYGYLIGFPSSILRANLMFTMLFIARLMAEPYDSINALFLSFWILILFSPLSVLSIGFQLSYAASFSILYLAPRISKSFYPLESDNRFRKNLISTISALIGLYIGILPIQIYYFNEFSALSIVSNIIIAPIISFVLIASFALLIVEFIFSPLNFLIGFVINICLNIQSVLVDIIHQFSFLNFKFASPDIGELILYYILIFIIVKTIDFSYLKGNVNRAIYTYLVFIVLIGLGLELNDNSLEIDFIDVGQGDAALLRTRSGDYLIDTGGEVFGDFDICKNITLPYLEKHGVKKLKGLFVSHFHLDHCKGIPVLEENLDIERIFFSYANPESEIYNYIIDSGIPATLLEAGDEFFIDKNTSISVLSPSSIDRDMGYSENNLSLVLEISYYNRKILFTGDAEMETENYIGEKLTKVDILKVGHHGSATSSTENFLDKTRPDIALISVGRNNSYGHPSTDVIDRLDNFGVNIYRTDLDGMTKITMDREKLDIRPFLAEDGLAKDNNILLALLLIYYLSSYILSRNYLILDEELNYIEI